MRPTTIPCLFAPVLLLACATSADGSTPDDVVPTVHVETGTVAPAVFNTVGPISDEGSRSFGSCVGQKAIYGMQCTGRYCDNVYLFCEDVPSFISLNSDVRWRTSWFSEESSLYTSCATGPGGVQGVITGVACAGSYCDNMQLECTAIRTGRINTSYSYTIGFSEEEPAQLWNRPAWALSCSGRYCDKLWVATADFLP